MNVSCPSEFHSVVKERDSTTGREKKARQGLGRKESGVKC
jgi:hypothetical protein